MRSVVLVGVRGRLAVVVARGSWHWGRDERRRAPPGADERHRRVL